MRCKSSLNLDTPRFQNKMWTSDFAKTEDKCLYCAHWVEHILAAACEPYLKTPEDELSFFDWDSLDVYATLTFCCYVRAWLALPGIRLLGT